VSRLSRLLLAVVALAILTAHPAGAHPQGLPGIVRVALNGSTVKTEWVLAPDDEGLLAKRLAETHQSRADYYRANFSIADCPMAASYEFHCPRPPTTLTIHSTLLLDLNPSYRTLVAIPLDGHTERRFLSAESTTTAVAITGDVGRAEQLADKRADKLPGLERRFIGVVDGPLSLGALAAGLAGALVVGAVHALSPGHGKSVAAAYLVGAEGRPIHALLLGGIVAAMHTGATIALGLATWYATGQVAPGDVLDATRTVTAVAVLAIGAYLVVTRTRARRHERPHEHAHAHGHHHHHPSTEAVKPFSQKGLVALGLSGGLLPSPSALVVLLAGLSAGRVPLALALVLAFSIGLAAAVAGAGLAVLKGRDLFEARLPPVLPLLAAYAVLVVGVVLTVSAF
jgi:ABC-type nickel/cobalt efflux system permease component RcnA